jgi:hypothetical protein
MPFRSGKRARGPSYTVSGRTDVAPWLGSKPPLPVKCPTLVMRSPPRAMRSPPRLMEQIVDWSGGVAETGDRASGFSLMTPHPQGTSRRLQGRNRRPLRGCRRAQWPMPSDGGRKIGIQ